MGQHTGLGARPSPQTWAPTGRTAPVTGTRLLPAPGPAEHDIEPVTAPLLIQRHLPPRVPHPRRPDSTSYPPVSLERGPGAPLGSPSPPGSQVHGRRRATLAALIVAVLLVLGAGGWWWVAHPRVDANPAPASAGAPLPGAPAPAAPTTAPDPGPMLLDEQGQPIASGPARAIRTFYRALDPFDPAALQRVTEPGQRSTVRATTAASATRDSLRQVMRTTRITHQDEGLVYRGPGGLQVAFGPDTALLYDLILPGSNRAAPAISSGTTPASAVPTLGAAGWTPDTTGYGQVRPLRPTPEATAPRSCSTCTGNLGRTDRDRHRRRFLGPTRGQYRRRHSTPAIVTASDLGPCRVTSHTGRSPGISPAARTSTSSGVSGYPDICTPL